MLAAEDNQVELPQVGSIGYLRGTGRRAQILRRNAPVPGEERRCLVRLFDLVRGTWLPTRDAGGNATVEERDLYADREDAIHCGRKPKRGRR